MLMTRPSTTPDLNWNAGTSLAIFVSAFASATGSAWVYAMELVPLRFFSKSCAGVPCPARSASVFLTTLYLPPAACTARRSLVSSSTVMPWKVERITVETFASSVFSLSRSACFSLRFFMIPFPFIVRSGLGRSRVGLRLDQVDWNSRTHRRGQRNLLDVLALGRRRLRFQNRADQRVRVLGDFRAVKLNLAD